MAEKEELDTWRPVTDVPRQRWVEPAPPLPSLADRLTTLSALSAPTPRLTNNSRETLISKETASLFNSGADISSCFFVGMEEMN